MALDPDRSIEAGGADEPPRLWSRPTDAPEPVGHLSGTPAALELQRLREASSAKTHRRHEGMVLRMRAWLSRVSGRADRRALRVLADATIALVERCDLLADRLTAQEAVVDEVARALGEELTRLRAEVAHLARVHSGRRDGDE
jgi:hypothetical protein